MVLLPRFNPIVAQQSCSGITCQPCSGSQKCIRVGWSDYKCLAPKQEGQSCVWTNWCGECASGLNCTGVSLGTYICLAPGTNPNKFGCDPYTCLPCSGNQKCIQIGPAAYACTDGKKEAESCNPVNLCGDCGYGLQCTDAGWGSFLCLPPGADPAKYACNPWSNEPCKSQGKVCTQTALTYVCQDPTATATSSAGLSATQICSFVTGSDHQKCVDCFAIPGVYTPFGCIETDPQKFISKILKIAIGIAGGIAFLMIIYGGFVIMTSSGNPEKLTNGKEILTSAISGLLLIIFSVVILKIIGVDILGIPGLT